MKFKNRLTVLTASLIGMMASAAAHSGNQSYYGPGMMWSDGGGWMHNGWHMAGYNMWGAGWFGVLFGLTFWALAFLGILYLLQLISEESNTDSSE